MDINHYLFKDEAYRGELTALKFRWILIAVVMGFILITFLKGDTHEALLSFIPAGVFLFYNFLLSLLIKQGRNIYFLRYISVTGIFFLKIPDMVFRYISKQKEMMEMENNNKFKLIIEKSEKEILRTNLAELNTLHAQLQQKSAEIERQNIKLSELVRTKDRLISFISHDLKNSFSTMASIIETTRENVNNLDSKDIYDAMDILYKHSVNNHILFENLLQWAKVQRGTLSTSKEKINLNEFFLQAHKQIQSQLEIKNIELNISISPDSVVLADRIMLNSICYNILGNAIKFTPIGGKIQILSEIFPNYVKISIKDNGIGIKQEILPFIFNIENTITTAGTEGEKGSGFGLILCKELIEKNGGTIEVESEEEKEVPSLLPSKEEYLDP